MLGLFFKFLNADYIAAGLSPFDPDAAAIRAGRIMLEEIDRACSQGGHNIPEPVIRRRFAAGYELFQQVYKQAVDAWYLLDNTLGSIKLIECDGNPVDYITQYVIAGNRMPEDKAIAKDTLEEMKVRYDVMTDHVKKDCNEREYITYEEADPFGKWILDGLAKAYEEACDLAIRTDTAIVTMRDGKIVRLGAKELIAEREAKSLLQEEK